VAQVSAPRPGKPVPLSPAESRCVPFCRRISIRPLAWLPAGPTALTHAATARLKRPTLEIRFASQFSHAIPRDSLWGNQQFGWTGCGVTRSGPTRMSHRRAATSRPGSSRIRACEQKARNSRPGQTGR
jgi:hypothetical protein